MLQLHRPKEWIEYQLNRQSDQFITNPPITKLDTCLRIEGKNTRLTALRVSSGIKFKHLVEFWGQYTTPASEHSRWGEPSRNGDLNAFYACFIVCENCKGHVGIPDRFDTDIHGEPVELARLRPKIARSARQFGTMQERYEHYQLRREKFYGSPGRLAFEQERAMNLPDAIKDMAGTQDGHTLLAMRMGTSTFIAAKSEYVVGENDTQQ
jgi:hypothetical protein